MPKSAKYKYIEIMFFVTIDDFTASNMHKYTVCKNILFGLRKKAKTVIFFIEASSNLLFYIKNLFTIF